MVEIQDDDTRGTLIQRLPDISELGVGTGLGGAVQSAMHILANTGPVGLRETGGEILLLTDGIETVKGWLKKYSLNQETRNLLFNQLKAIPDRSHSNSETIWYQSECYFVRN